MVGTVKSAGRDATLWSSLRFALAALVAMLTVLYSYLAMVVLFASTSTSWHHAIFPLVVAALPVAGGWMLVRRGRRQRVEDPVDDIPTSLLFGRCLAYSSSAVSALMTLAVIAIAVFG
jgi:hypothetical protein